MPKHSLPDRPVDLPAIQLCRDGFMPAYQLGSRAASEPRFLKTWVNISPLAATLTVGLQSQRRVACRCQVVWRLRRITGMVRLSFRSYSAKTGNLAACRAKMASRSTPTTSVARTRIVSVPFSIVISELAMMLLAAIEIAGDAPQWWGLHSGRR